MLIHAGSSSDPGYPDRWPSSDAPHSHTTYDVQYDDTHASVKSRTIVACGV